MKYIYTDEQFAELAKFEDLIDIYTHHNYTPSKGVSFSDIKRLAEIHRTATGSRIQVNPTCSSCVKRVLRAIGPSYFTDKETRAIAARKEAAKKRIVSVSEETPKTEKKVVKTTASSSGNGKKKTAATKKTAKKKK